MLAKWLEERPFLDELAALYQSLDEAFASNVWLPEADWQAAEKALTDGITLLEGGFITLDKTVDWSAALAQLSTNPALPKEFRRRCIGLEQELHESGLDLFDLLMDAEKISVDSRAVAGFILPVAMRALLAQHAEKLTEWLDEKAWQESTCPCCGGKPLTAQLKKTQKGRTRYLVCGDCGTKWHYQRMGCPYCGETEQKNLGILESETEKDIRIDVCESCKSYLKTYIKEGMEEVALNDWASAHMDAACDGMGYQKHGAVLVLE
jgi:FdhE protein